MEEDSVKEVLRDDFGSDTLEKRKQKLFSYFKKDKKWIVYGIFALIAWFGFYIRTRNIPLLKDITTGLYIPADPDAFAFWRYARYISEHGQLMNVDYMRYYPWGYSNLVEFKFLSHFIADLYNFLSFFNSSITIEYVDVLYPAIAFVFGLLFFFLLVKKLFDYRVALLSTLLLTIIPSYLFRTMSGISDKEALGMVFFFAALYFFVCGWQSESIKKNMIFGVLTGLSTGLMGLVWGGFAFLVSIIGLFGLINFSFLKFRKQLFFTYFCWYFIFYLIMIIFRGYMIYSIIGVYFGAAATLSLIVGIGNYIVLKYNLEKRIEEKFKIPYRSVILIVGVLIGLIFSFLVIGPNIIFNQVHQIYDTLTNPFGNDRWQLTVAEAHQPYLTELIGQVGWKFFWIYIAGSILLVYEFLKGLKKRVHDYGLIIYLLFIFGFSFSRYSPSPILNEGINASKLFLKSLILIGFIIFLFYLFIHDKDRLKRWLITVGSSYFLFLMILFSKTQTGKILILDGVSFFSQNIMYFGTMFLLILSYLGYYLYTYYRDKETFEKIKSLNWINLFILIGFFVLLVASRSAIRLYFIYSVIIVFFVAYFTVKLFDFSLNIKKDLIKIGLWILLFLILINPFSISETFAYGFLDKGIILDHSQRSLNQARYIGPGYNQQWQIAGKWVRENTPENAIFAHWWDYGYFVQGGFERASVTDGGNARISLNHFMGRSVLTGQNEIEALEFLKAHNVTHLLIISDEIGKYPAFSSIGSDKNWDRYSWVQSFVLDPKRTQETRDMKVYTYVGVSPIDWDFTYKGEFYPKGDSAIIGFFIPTKTINEITTIENPSVIVVNNGQQNQIPLECIFVNGQEINFNQIGLKGCLQIIPTIERDKVNSVGAGIYVSEKVRRTLFAQLYLFGKPGKYFNLVYNDEQGMPLALYNGRIIGPLKIWKVSYPGNLNIPEYYYSDILPNPNVTNIEGRY